MFASYYSTVSKCKHKTRVTHYNEVKVGYKYIHIGFRTVKDEYVSKISYEYYLRNSTYYKSKHG